MHFFVGGAQLHILCPQLQFTIMLAKSNPKTEHVNSSFMCINHSVRNKQKIPWVSPFFPCPLSGDAFWEMVLEFAAGLIDSYWPSCWHYFHHVPVEDANHAPL